jgi:ubiquinone biosynthesis protein UbiJ
MSGHGKREEALRADAIHWLDRVVADVESPKGRAAARKHRVSIDLINKVAAKIAGYIARGEDVVSRADAVAALPGSSWQARRAVACLEARGHIQPVVDDRELIRPIGIGPPELPLA